MQLVTFDAVNNSSNLQHRLIKLNQTSSPRELFLDLEIKDLESCSIIQNLSR